LADGNGVILVGQELLDDAGFRRVHGHVDLRRHGV
jgi:hypothetical protein